LLWAKPPFDPAKQDHAEGGRRSVQQMPCPGQSIQLASAVSAGRLEEIPEPLNFAARGLGIKDDNQAPAHLVFCHQWGVFGHFQVLGEPIF